MIYMINRKSKYNLNVYLFIVKPGMTTEAKICQIKTSAAVIPTLVKEAPCL